MMDLVIDIDDDLKGLEIEEKKLLGETYIEMRLYFNDAEGFSTDKNIELKMKKKAVKKIKQALTYLN